MCINPNLEKILLESKLDFSFVSFSFKLNCLDFFFFIFDELMSVFFIRFLFRYFVCEDLERNKL